MTKKDGKKPIDAEKIVVVEKIVENSDIQKVVFEALKDGFMAGINAQSGILLPSKKLQIFLSQKGYK